MCGSNGRRGGVKRGSEYKKQWPQHTRKHSITACAIMSLCKTNVKGAVMANSACVLINQTVDQSYKELYRRALYEGHISDKISPCVA